jgi:hypothetical protein
MGRSVGVAVMSRREQKTAFEVLDHGPKLELAAGCLGTDALDGFPGQHGPSMGEMAPHGQNGASMGKTARPGHDGPSMGTTAPPWATLQSACPRPLLVQPFNDENGSRCATGVENRCVGETTALAQNGTFSANPSVGIGAAVEYIVRLQRTMLGPNASRRNLSIPHESDPDH